MKIAKIILLLALALAIPKFMEQEYTIMAEVIDVTQPNEYFTDGNVICKGLENGNEYEFEGSEDWFEGDRVDLTLNDNGTPETTADDYVVKTIYRGCLIEDR